MHLIPLTVPVRLMDFRHRLTRQKLTDTIPEPTGMKTGMKSPGAQRPQRRTSKTPSRVKQKKRMLTRQDSSSDDAFYPLRSSSMYPLGEYDDSNSLLRRSLMNARAERQAETKEHFHIYSAFSGSVIIFLYFIQGRL